MLKELKDKWLAALRSGEYRQGKAALRKHSKSQDESQDARFDMFCCLGVLCDVYDPYSWVDGNITKGYVRLQNDGYPSDEVLNNVGLPYDLSRKLGKLNDAGKTFGDIADFIESQVF